MRRFSFILCAAALLVLSGELAAQTTINYDDTTLVAPWDVGHWDDVWDLTQGDLTLAYTIDMSTIIQPGTWDTFIWQWTTYVEVGLRGEDAGDFNPGPFGVYQGRCGGWMVSDSDVWADGDGYTEKGADPDSTQDLDDKHALQASGGRGEGDYDVLADDWDDVLSPFGSGNNFGIWFDRDGVDQWQANMWGNLGPGGVGSGDGLRYNTGGVYDIVITYHAIDANGNGDKSDDGLGVMFATVNGYPQGFYTSWVNGEPQLYPAGLSFKGDMKHMQVFAGLWAPQYLLPGHDFGTATLSDITVTGYLGTSDPLVADFTYSPDPVFTGQQVQFTDATAGGMPPYTYEWDFNGDGEVDAYDQNPTWTYDTAGTYTVKLSVTPFRCVPKTVSDEITVACPAYLNVVKFYDANANGVDDDDQEISGWTVSIDGINYYTPVAVILPAGDHNVSEYLGGTWMATTPTSVDITLACDEQAVVSFGNLCLGYGGGLTPGYWSNKNGMNTFNNVIGTSYALEALRDLNLWQAIKKGVATEFDPATYAAFKAWLKDRNAVDMRYQLSAQLAAMKLNVMAGFVDDESLVYADSALGFMSIGELMTAANDALGNPGATRDYLEQLKNALDWANNNYNFVQPEPCSVLPIP